GFGQTFLRALRIVAAVFGQRLRVDHGGDIAAAVAQVRRQDLRVPAAAGSDLDYGLARRDAEEGQRVGRVPVLVAGAVGLAAPVASDGRLQRCVGRGCGGGFAGGFGG